MYTEPYPAMLPRKGFLSPTNSPVFEDFPASSGPAPVPSPGERKRLYRQLAFCYPPVKGIIISRCPFYRAFYTSHSEHPLYASSSRSLLRAPSAKRTEPNCLSKRMHTSAPIFHAIGCAIAHRDPHRRCASQQSPAPGLRCYREIIKIARSRSERIPRRGRLLNRVSISSCSR